MEKQRGYRLVCSACGRGYEDDGLRLECDAAHGPALLRTEYQTTDFRFDTGGEGVFRYKDWLPVVRTVPGSAAPIAYRAEGLGRVLGLRDLWVVFGGHWPERDAHLPTGTFKDLEAGVVLGRLPDDPPVLVLASAGNTAVAFAEACSRQGARCLIIVPGYAVGRLALAARSACVGVVAVESGTYDDAIRLADAVGALPGFQLEGGIRNVGRRDGLATCLLAAFEAAGRIPAFYVQAVGSGAGAIAAYEAARRLRSGGCPDPLPKLLLCQNSPYAPLHSAWHAKPGPTGDPNSALAPELTNSRPPFAIPGGVREALLDAGGTVLAAGNDQTRQAVALFEDTEGIDIEPAAGVAVAALADAVRARLVDPDAPVLLNITGGGRRGLFAAATPTRPDLVVDVKEIHDPAALDVAAKAAADVIFP